MGYFEQDRLLLDIEARVRGQEQVVALSEAIAELMKKIGVQQVANMGLEQAKVAESMAKAQAQLELAAQRRTNAELAQERANRARETQEAKQSAAKIKGERDSEAAVRARFTTELRAYEEYATFRTAVEARARQQEVQRGAESVAIARRTEEQKVAIAREAVERTRLIRAQALADVRAGGEADLARAQIAAASAGLGAVPTGGSTTAANILAAEQIRLQQAVTSVNTAFAKQEFTLQRAFGYWWKFHAVLIAARTAQDMFNTAIEAWKALLTPSVEVDAWQRQLEAVTGSLEKSRQIVAAIRAEAAGGSPFPIKELGEAVTLAEAFHVSWSKVGPGLEAVAAALDKPLTDVTSQLLKVSEGGLRGAKALAINALQYARELGIAVHGSITGSDLENYRLFLYITEQIAQKYPRSVKQASQSIRGELIQIQNAWYELRLEIAEGGVGQKVAEDLHLILEGVRELQKDGSLRQLATDMGEYLTANLLMAEKTAEAFLKVYRTYRLIKTIQEEAQLYLTRNFRTPPKPGTGAVPDATGYVRSPVVMGMAERLGLSGVDGYPDTGSGEAGRSDRSPKDDAADARRFRWALDERLAAANLHGQQLVDATIRWGNALKAAYASHGPAAVTLVEEAHEAMIHDARMTMFRERASAYNSAASKADKDFERDRLANLKALASMERTEFRSRAELLLAQENAFGRDRVAAARRVVDAIAREMGSLGLVTEWAQFEKLAADVVHDAEVAGIKDLNRSPDRDPRRLFRDSTELLREWESPYETFYSDLEAMRARDFLSQEELRALDREYLAQHLDDELSYYDRYFTRLGAIYGVGYSALFGAGQKFYQQIAKETERYLLHKKTSAGVEIELGKQVVRAAEAAGLQKLGSVLGLLAKEDAVNAAREAKLAAAYSSAGPFGAAMAAYHWRLAAAYGANALAEGIGAGLAYGAANAILTRESANQQGVDAAITGDSGGRRSTRRTETSTDRSLRTVGVAQPVNNYFTLSTVFEGGVFMGKETGLQVAETIAPFLDRLYDNQVLKLGRP